MDWLINLFTKLSNVFEQANVGRFDRWSKFLGRKMFLGLVTMIILTTTFLTMLILVLAYKDGDAMKALGSELWTGYCMLLGTVFGAAAGTNVMEHNASAKVKIAQAAPGATPVTPPAEQ